MTKSRTPAETQENAKRNFDALMEKIPADVHRREERLVADLRALNARPIAKLVRIYKSAGTLFSYAGEFVACRKGCAYCCHLAIQVSQVEADNIGEKTGIIPVKLKNSVSRDPYGFSEKTPCPFLKEGQCSIYEHRPLICRAHVNLDIDAYWCEYENWSKHGSSVPEPTFHSLTNAYSELNAKAHAVVADIRDFFPKISGD
jgi:hypothetical protein